MYRVLSFFFYAIARGWIGETLQVLMGVVAGFILFFVAYVLREKNEIWSNIVFGGAYFLEYVSLGVGVSVYRIMPEFVGVGFGALVLASSVALCIKFSSRAIAYFSLVGGFLIPIITDVFDSHGFVMFWYLLLLIALSFVSVSNNWGELRGVMLFFITIFVWSTFNTRGSADALEFLFLVLYFFLFNVSSLVNSISNKKEIIPSDTIILGALPVLFLPLLYGMMGPGSEKVFGLAVILFSFVYLLEALIMRDKGVNFVGVIYALVSAGVATLNFGIYFLFNEFLNVDFFIVFFIVQWALFSYLASSGKDLFYRVMSFIFLGLIAIWYLSVLRFNQGMGHATLFIFVLLSLPLIAMFFFRSNINYKTNAAIFIISGYAFLYSLSKYFWFFMPNGDANIPALEVILSVMWLIYTLTLFVQVQTKEGKMLVGVLLGITLLKIAFKDLFFLEGVARIVGFILFGILLLIGGYFLKNETK
jgi:hypothetical protein